MLQTFHDCTGLPVQIKDGEGKTLLQCGQRVSFCQRLHQYVFSESECAKNYRDAAVYAQRFGDAYIFACQANLNHIALALCDRGLLLGMVLVGPFLMDRPDATLVSGLTSSRTLPPDRLLDLYDELSGIPVLPPDRVHPMGRLVAYLFSTLIPAAHQAQLQNRERLYQQSRIGEMIQRIKFQQGDGEGDEGYQMEKALIHKVKVGDIGAAKALLNELLGTVFFSQGGKLEGIKNRALELCTLLSRVAIESGAGASNTFRLNDRFLALLQKADNLEDLCLQMQEIVEAFVDSTLPTEGSVNNPAIRRAIRYIRQHYTEDLSLEEVAGSVKLSPAYFSSLFRRCTGNGFKNYLNHLRVEESKRLLADTDEAIVDIAMSMGFGDQSYFTKVFKKYTGLSPNQYR